MIREGLSKQTETVTGDPTRGGTLILLSIATSIDALGVGLSLSILQTNIALSSFMIGLVSLLFTILGLKFGNRLNNRFGKKIVILGGLVLLVIGSRLLFSHLNI